MAAANQFGCNHYKRKCQLVSPCCGEVYTCRFCHDERENHTLDRKAIKEVICLGCGHRQQVSKQCVECDTLFGKYACLICNFFEDEDREQFHCVDCGICRIGCFERYYHCKTCNTCLSIKMISNHICLENVSRSDCPVCMEFLHSSTTSLISLKCGHILHHACYVQLQEQGHLDCPTCKERFLV